MEKKHQFNRVLMTGYFKKNVGIKLAVHTWHSSGKLGGKALKFLSYFPTLAVSKNRETV